MRRLRLLKKIRDLEREVRILEEARRFCNVSIWPEDGLIESTLMWADSQPLTLTVRFSVTPDEWNEFQTSPAYQSLEAAVHRSALQIQDTNKWHHEQERKAESDLYGESSKPMNRR